MGPLKIGLWGCGGIVRHHARELLGLDGVEIAALVEPSEGALSRLREEFPVLAGVRSFSADTEADDLALDAVVIATPHTLHVGQMERAFGLGRHVLCEKPLATTVADAHRAIAARDRSGRVGAIAYQRHGQPAFQAMRRRIQSGEMGKVLCVNSHLAQQWLQFTRGTWRQDPALSGGGQLNDSGSHMIDMLLWVTGLRARRVGAMIDNRGAEVDIDSVVSVEFEGGALGSLAVIGDAALWHEQHQVWLERGAMILHGETLSVLDEHGVWSKTDSWPPGVSPVRNFIAAVRGTSEVAAPFECGLRVIELTEAAWRSGAQGGTPVDVAAL